jgi:hypothetical protein
MSANDRLNMLAGACSHPIHTKVAMGSQIETILERTEQKGGGKGKEQSKREGGQGEGSNSGSSSQ